MNFKRVCFIMILLIMLQHLVAQDTTGVKQEVWPEVNLFYKVNNKLRVFTWYSTTKLKNSGFTDGGYGIALDYFTLPWLKGRIDYLHGKDSVPGQYLWLRVGYSHSNTPADAKDPVTENTFLTEANGRFYLGHDILLTNKNRLDWRFINGDFKPRYRCKLTIEKDMRSEYLFFTPYIFGEYFINLYEGGSDANRFRLCGGSELKVARHINFEVYFLYQFDNGKALDALTAAGFVLKFYFNHQAVKQKFKAKGKANT